METIHKIGRRKTAVARAYLSSGEGKITVNNKDLKDYFTIDTLNYKVKQPLVLTNNEKNFNLNVRVNGVGITEQAKAIRFAFLLEMLEVTRKNGRIIRPKDL